MMPRPANSVQNGASFSEKTLAYWACRKAKDGLSVIESAVGKYARAAFAKREKNRDVCLEHQIVRRAFSVREVKRAAAAEERERDEYFSAEIQ